VCGQARAHPPGDVLDQWGISDDETLAGTFIPGGLVPSPEILELDRFDVGFQCLPPVLALRARMRAFISGAKPSRLYPSVNLSGRDARVPEQFLDRPEIRSTFQ
jgi:hypothetical protein